MPTNFLTTPKRSTKPRDYGLTSLIDNGVPTKYFIDVIESDAHLIDIVKFGWCTGIVTKDLEVKIECLIKHNVDYYFGGTLFEKALSQNKLDEFYQFLKYYNCKIMEVSDGTLKISSQEKARHITDFSKEFYVLSEVGKKDIVEADNMPISQWIDEIHRDLAAGAKKVILESRESGKSGICDAQGNLRTDLVSSITKSRFRASDAIWEAPNKMLQSSLISSIGPNVNLANIAFGDVIGLETLRLGIRSDTFHLYDATGTDFTVPQANRASFIHEDRRGSRGLITDRSKDRRG
jgi:phosphosulfolactate synthase